MADCCTWITTRLPALTAESYLSCGPAGPAATAVDEAAATGPLCILIRSSTRSFTDTDRGMCTVCNSDESQRVPLAPSLPAYRDHPQNTDPLLQTRVRATMQFTIHGCWLIDISMRTDLPGTTLETRLFPSQIGFA